MQDRQTQEIKNTVVLFDGHNMLFRYFWGMPRTIISTRGDLIHGAYGFVAAVIQHLQKFMPARAIVCFDSEGPPERVSREHTYKQNRQWEYGSTPQENPFTQLRFIEDAMSLLRVKIVASPGVEADDLIATCTRLFRGTGTHIYIASTDQDLLQLVDEGVSIYLRRGKKEWLFSPSDVEAKYGVPASRLVAWRAMVGDASDNLPGVPGIGPTRATMLLQRYGSLPAIYENLSALTPQMAHALQEHRQRVDRNIDLIALRNRAPLERQLSLETVAERPILNFNVRQIFRLLGLF